MRHEVREGHFPTSEKRYPRCEEPEHDETSTNKLDHTGQPQQGKKVNRLLRAERTEQLLHTMQGEEKPGYSASG